MFKVFNKESEMKAARASKANLFISHMGKLGPREDMTCPRLDSKVKAELGVEHRSPLTIQQMGLGLP